MNRNLPLSASHMVYLMAYYSPRYLWLKSKCLGHERHVFKKHDGMVSSYPWKLSPGGCQKTAWPFNFAYTLKVNRQVTSVALLRFIEHSVTWFVVLLWYIFNPGFDIMAAIQFRIVCWLTRELLRNGLRNVIYFNENKLRQVHAKREKELL